MSSNMYTRTLRILSSSSKSARTASPRLPLRLSVSPSLANILVVLVHPPRTLLHTSTSFSGKSTNGQAPDSSRDAKEDTLLEQNPHLKHAVTSRGGSASGIGEGRDFGSGNADPEGPVLPSRMFGDVGEWKKGKEERGKRGLYTSAVVLHEGSRRGGGKGGEGEGDTKHTAETYFKEVDLNPISDKTFRVDGDFSSSSSGSSSEFSPATHRPHEQYADPSKEYATVSKEEPYEPPSERNGGEKREQREQTLRYGGRKRDALRDAPGKEEGPQDKNAGRLKP